MNPRWLLVASLILCGCSKYRATETPDPSSVSFFTPGDGSLSPAGDQISNSCLSDSAFDACIFQKNPVAQEKASVTDINSVRRFGIKLRGLSPTGFLENARLRVLTLSTPRASLLDRSKFKSSVSPETSYLEQVSAYYYANLALEYLDQRVGVERMPAGSIKIYVDDAFTGYSSTNNSLHFEKKTTRTPKALSGEVVVQLLGQALASRLSGWRVHEGGITQHKNCELEARGCCSTTAGCAQALLNSFGDYVSAMIFPSIARLGETIGGTPQGQLMCSHRRDLTSLSTKQKTLIYASCPNQGYAVLMGSWYASVWWRMRGQLEAQEAGSAQDIDRLFFEHARAWTGSFTFADAKAEALRLSALYKDGKYTSALTAAFQSAGI